MAIVRSFYETWRFGNGYKGEIDIMGFSLEYFARRMKDKDLGGKEAYLIGLSKLSMLDLEQRFKEEEITEIKEHLNEGVITSIKEFQNRKDISSLIKVKGEENDWDTLQTDFLLTLPDILTSRMKEEYLKKISGC